MKRIVIILVTVLLCGAAAAQTVTVTGAGDNVPGAETQVNGPYSFDMARTTSAGTYNDYERDGSIPSGGGGACLLIYFNNNNSIGTNAIYTDKWIIINFCTIDFADEVRYFADEFIPGNSKPPGTGWQVASGAAPAPTLAGDVSLPVSLLSFTATAAGPHVTLQWRTAWEQNNDFIAVERSTDGRTFDEIGRLAGQGTTASPVDYRYVDSAPPAATLYYRLRQVDFDGAVAYHPTVVLRTRHVAGARLWPTVAENTLHVATGPMPWHGGLHDAYGRLLRPLTIAAGTTVQLDVSGLPTGAYYLRSAHPVRALRFVRP